MDKALNPDVGDYLLTTEEVAARLRVSKDTVLDYVNYKIIRAFKFNRRTFRFHWPTVLEDLRRNGRG